MSAATPAPTHDVPPSAGQGADADASGPFAPGRTRKTLLGLCAAALLLRLLGKLNSGLWYDEIWTLVDFGRLPFLKLVTSFGTDNNHPLYSLLSWLSLRTLGESAFALRLPALVFGVLSIGALYVYARRVTNESQALIATLLLTTSYHHVWFSQNARGYTLLLFFTIASTYFFEDLLDGRSRRSIFPYALTLALGTYSHLTGLFVAFAHLAVYAHVLAYAHERKARPAYARLWPLQGLVLAGVVSVLLHALLLRDMIAFFTKPGGSHGHVTSAWSSPWWTIAEVARSLGFGLFPGLFVLGSALLVLVVGSVSYARQSVPRLLLFLLPGAFGVAAMLALGRNLWPRFFFFQAGFILLIVVRGLSAITGWLARASANPNPERIERGLFALAIGVLTLAWLAMLPRAYFVPKQDFEGAMHYVQANRKPGEVVLTTGLTVLPYQRYYRTDFVPVETLAELDHALSTSRGAYVLHTLPTFLEARVPELTQALAQRGREVKRFRGSVGDGDVIVLRLPAPAKE
ncbi:MAG TPA: glycosyltransferase family 39 protein [Polyangiales bacterium]